MVIVPLTSTWSMPRQIAVDVRTHRLDAKRSHVAITSNQCFEDRVTLSAGRLPVLHICCNQTVTGL
jgi:hypothetical protein